MREAFGLRRLRAWRAARCALAARQAFTAPDPARAVTLMTRFHDLAGRAPDPRRAALLEVHWWAEHLEVERVARPAVPGALPLRPVDDAPSVAALTRFYAYLHGTPEHRVRPAAALRVGGIRRAAEGDPGLREGRRLLLASYVALADALR